MQNIHTRNFYLLILLICLFTSCTFFHTRKDSRVVENIEAYESLAVKLSKIEEEGSIRRFQHDFQLKQFRNLFREYGLYEDISKLHQDDLLTHYGFQSSKEISFGTKIYSTWYLTKYIHILIYRADNKLPVFNNGGEVSIRRVKEEKIKENWFYVIMSYSN